MDEPQPEASAQGLVAVHSDDALTLVCLADGTEVRVPFAAAARESELVRIQMDDVEEAAPRLDVHELDEVTAAAFAAFLQGQPADPAVSAAGFFRPGAEENTAEKRVDPSGRGSFTLAGFKRFHGAEAGRQVWVKAGETMREACRRIRLCGAHGPVADFLGDGPQGFAALYAAADYLIAPRWRSLLVDAWATALLAGLSPPALATAAEAAAAALDPAVSPLLQQELPEAVLFQFLDLPETEVAAHARRELVRRVPMLPDLALAKLRGFRRDLARQELLRRHPQLTPFDNDSLRAAVKCLKDDYNSTGGCAATEAELGPLSLWDTKLITDMSSLFCDALCDASEQLAHIFGDGHRSAFSKTFTADLSGWDVGRVESMECMFQGALAFTSDLSRWDVGRVESMGAMFCNAAAFTSDLSGWSVGRVENMKHMFCGASAFTSDLPPGFGMLWKRGGVSAFTFTPWYKQ